MKLEYKSECVITDVKGVECSGLKEGKNGLGIVRCSGKVAGVFTTNKIKAAPVILSKKNVEDGRIEGIVVNSGNANAFTGEKGLRNAEKMAELLSEKIGCSPKDIAVSSTGVIGVQLDMEWITNAIDRVYPELGSSGEHAMKFAKSIMTTDSFPKMWGVKVGECKVVGVAKGAGMIAPNMATMLSYIFTDAKLEVDEMREILRKAVDGSFNVTVVDGDTSTNDTVLLVSTCKKKVDVKDVKKVEKAVKEVCLRLAEMIAADGEGSTKLMRVIVKAKNERDAFRAARTIASSTLVKTALFGCDPNWGRIVAALGYSGVDVDENISLTLRGYKTVEDSWFNPEFVETQILVEGRDMGNRDKAKKIMESCKVIEYLVDLHGDSEGFAIGCDLSYGYVKLNSEYTT